MTEPDPRFLAGEDAVLTNTADMAWVLAAGWDGAVDMHSNVDKPTLASQLRFIADRLDPPGDTP